MDIHRCRFVPYQPQSINALAFSHSNSKQRTPTDLRLALGRENGDVEIWNPSDGTWVQEKVLRGRRDQTVEQLSWTQDLVVDEDNQDRPIDDGNLRLFSSGGSTSITEWDITAGVPKRQAESNFGEIWCFSAQPQWRSTAKSNLSRVAAAPSQMLVAGCSDGTIVLFSTADDGLTYVRTLAQRPTKKSKVISITWQNRDTVIAGYEDSMIQVIDVTRRIIIRTMSLGRPVNDNHAVVWTVKCMPDGTVLSGDSTGELKIWDAENYSLVQRLKTHEADILDIATSRSGDLIFSAGVDRRTVVYQPDTTQPGKRKTRWRQVMHKRFHQHDVKALASFESKEMSILVSGGMDTVPIVVPLRKFDSEYHRSLPHLPQKPQMSCSTTTRLMLTWWAQDLYLWQLPRRTLNLDQSSSTTANISDHKLLARITLSGDDNITSAQISKNGAFISVATSTEVKLFQIRTRVVKDETEVRMRPLELPTGIKAFGAATVGFSPDNKWLYSVRGSNTIALVKIMSKDSPKERPTVHGNVVKLSRKARKIYSGKLGSYRRFINCVVFSSDSRILCTGDLSGAIDAWVLQGHENLADIEIDEHRGAQDSSSDSDSNSDSDSDDETDSSIVHGQRWIRNPAGANLPLLDSAIIAMGFKPLISSVLPTQYSLVGLHATRHNPHPVSHESPPPSMLVAITADHTIVEFDVLAAKLTDWSRRNPSSRLPAEFTQIKDRVMDILWDCTVDHERMYLYGPSFLFMLDMSRDLSAVDAQEKIGKLGRYDVREALPESSDKDVVDNDGTMTLYVDRPSSKKRKRNTGAGDQIRKGEWQRRELVRSSVTDGGDNEMDIDTGLLSPVSESDGDDDDVDMTDMTLTTFRRRAAIQNLPEQDKDSNKTLRHTERTLETRTTKAFDAEPTSLPCFLTTRYRAIYGIAALNDLGAEGAPDAVDQSNEHLPGLEVVLVERPMYDVELLPRFDGGQDW